MTLPHRASLAQARGLLRLLAGAEGEHLAAGAFRLEHEHDMRRGRYVVRVRVLKPVPQALPELAARTLRALRTSLDELSASLAGSPVRFPVFESLALFAQRTRKAMAPMPDEAQASLEALQPYHAIGGFRNGPLWTLQQLDSAGPPRLVGSLRAGASMGVNTQRQVTVAADPIVKTGPFADGDVVAAVPATIAGPDPKLDMFLRAEYALAFAPDGPGRGREVAALLGELCDHVERVVLPMLEPNLPKGD